MKFKKIITAVLTAGMLQAALNIPFPSLAADTLLAFPGAEGGGKYTKGARASSSQTVYHVTNLNDKGEGSLRDAVSKSGRIVVFDVGGVIKLNSKLNIGSKVTILGQTAPGDGITITNYDVQIEQKNDVIMRYIRVRPTDDQGGEPDGLGGRFNKNIIVDHCSVSWGVDELLTIYGGSYESGTPSENVTVQYCLSAESLRMSNHIKGAHGYGGIIGGNNATYHHNLFAHHDSRSPRLDRNLQNTDMVNNVIYDWGNTNSVYGAEPYSYNKQAQYSTPDYISRVNLRNNYYKYGPSTGQSLRSRIFEVTNDGTVKYNNEVLKSDFYIGGNYVYGNEDATQNNTKAAYIKNAAAANILDAPIDMGEAELPIESAEDAYETTLDNVGATLPKRDAIDARVVADVRNQTGRVINNDEEVGGITGFETVQRTFEIPQEWKSANGMGSAKETAIVPDGKWAGYTWIEAYVNDWTEQQEKPANPDITVTSPAIATADKTQDKTNKLGFWTVTADEYDVEYKMQAEAKPGTVITKTEVWDGEALLEAFDGSSSIETELSLKPGTHYLMSKAYNDRGECTVSPTSIVYVTGTDGALENAAEIGTAAGDARGSIAYPGKAAAWTRDDTVYVAGSGFINSGSDSCTYLYYPVKGDFSFSARLADMPKYENGALSGIMFRETLNANSRMAMIAETWYKYGENIVVPVRRTNGGGEAHNWMKDSSGKAVGNTSSYDTEKYPMPKYIKAERSGDVLTLSVSDNGTDWNDNIRQPYTVDVSGWPEDAYIGLAVDSMNGDFDQNGLKTSIPPLPWYTISEFSEVQTENVYGMDLPYPTTTPDIPEYDYRIREINIDRTNNTVIVSVENLRDEPAAVDLILAVKDKSAQTLVSAAIEKVEFDGIGSETIAREFGNTDLSDVVIEPFLWNNVNEMIPLRVSPEQ